ncbi:hypothetical protein R6Q57_011526, partial [Mikania cordata]
DANYVNIKELLELECEIVVDMNNGETPEEIRKMLNIMNDFNPIEEEECFFPIVVTKVSLLRICNQQ